MFAGYVEFDWERIQMLQHISYPFDLQEFQVIYLINLKRVYLLKSILFRSMAAMICSCIHQNLTGILHKLLRETLKLVYNSLTPTMASLKKSFWRYQS